MPTILITGGTGFIGKNLTSHLISKGYKVIILTRKADAESKNPQVSYAIWNTEKNEIDADALSRADYIIHLAGAGVMDKSWTDKYKNKIIESRTHTSQLLVKGLQQNRNKVKAVVSASAIGWYGKNPMGSDLSGWSGFEESDKPDPGFLGETCRLWEESIEPVESEGKRLVKFRFGIILGNNGGAFVEFKNPLRFGIAAILGNGKQIISWIHVEDVCRLLTYAIENETLSGSYNAVAPNPVTNKQLVIKNAEVMRRSFYIPVHVPNFLLKLILGERSIEVLKSTTVSCEKIRKAGFYFLYPSLDAALGELYK